MVQLTDGNDIDLKTGKITYASPLDRPYDWAKSGRPPTFCRDGPTGLAAIKTYADRIGPWKPYIVPVKGRLDAAGRLVDSALCVAEQIMIEGQTRISGCYLDPRR